MSVAVFKVSLAVGIYLQANSGYHEVQLEDMIWADKLAKANRSAGDVVRLACC